MGHDSHGIVHLPEHFSYIPGFESKMVNTQPHIKIEQNTPTITSVDGDRGLGIIGLYKGMELALNSAKDSGMGMAVVKNCYHAGALSYYTRKIADQGMIGIALVNTARLVAPPMGKKRAIGTNPISIGIPYHPNRPLLLDMATSVVASGKIEIARREGEKVPKGLIVDNEGRGTTNPDDYFNNGALLPLGGSPETGGYKGYGLGVMFDVLTGILSGLGHGMSINKEDGQAHTLLILNKRSEERRVGKESRYTRSKRDWSSDVCSSDLRGTTNPDDYFNNGALLPLGGSPETGGYKGYGLGVMFDVLTGILSGLGHGMSINKEDGQAHTLLILNK